jgi:hypothetical protein
MKLLVRHDVQPENEVFINATKFCDFCSRKLPEWKMHNYESGQSVCEDCVEHYTDKWRE